MERRRYVIELRDKPPSLDDSMSYGERHAALQQACQIAMDAFFQRLESFRKIDPDLEVKRRDGRVFPILFITTTQALFEVLRKDTEISAIYPAEKQSLVQ